MQHRWQVNISAGERAGRILVGLVGAVGGVVLLAGSPSLSVGILEVLLVLTGLDLLVTGALGHFPLYAKLHHVPRSLKRA